MYLQLFIQSLYSPRSQCMGSPSVRVWFLGPKKKYLELLVEWYFLLTGAEYLGSYPAFSSPHLFICFPLPSIIDSIKSSRSSGFIFYYASILVILRLYGYYWTSEVHVQTVEKSWSLLGSSQYGSINLLFWRWGIPVADLVSLSLSYYHFLFIFLETKLLNKRCNVSYPLSVSFQIPMSSSAISYFVVMARE